VGKNLELQLRAAFRELYDRQIAFIWKVPEALQQTPVDFFGWTAKGRAVVIEAKQVNRTSLAIGSSPGLAPHQFLALKQALTCGAHSFVVWQREDCIMVIGFDHFLRLADGRKSVSFKEAKHFRSMGLVHSFSYLLES
jgi:penicillin-binding protein-related factor A (putative recombinase)